MILLLTVENQIILSLPFFQFNVKLNFFVLGQHHLMYNVKNAVVQLFKCDLDTILNKYILNESITIPIIFNTSI